MFKNNEVVLKNVDHCQLVKDLWSVVIRLWFKDVEGITPINGDANIFSKIMKFIN